jgi:hypothetical protein
MKVWQGGAVPLERQASEVKELRTGRWKVIMDYQVLRGLSENLMLDNNLSFQRGHMSLAIKATAICIAICCHARSAGADSFVRTVPSGHAVRMHNYASWDRDCSSQFGVVKLVSKPQHGRLITREVETVITVPNRFNGKASCMGKSMRVFSVDYKSNAGYRGFDSFTIDATYSKRRRVIDHYKISVQ